MTEELIKKANDLKIEIEALENNVDFFSYSDYVKSPFRCRGRF